MRTRVCTPNPAKASQCPLKCIRGTAGLLAGEAPAPTVTRRLGLMRAGRQCLGGLDGLGAAAMLAWRASKDCSNATNSGGSGVVLGCGLVDAGAIRVSFGLAMVNSVKFV